MTAAKVATPGPRVMPAPDPAAYARLFDGHQDGPAVIEDLILRFCRPAKTDGGIDAILQTYHRAGARTVVEFIVSMINQANGVPDNDNE